MKCPYRQIKTKIKVNDLETTTDNEFKECLYGECPYYQPETNEPYKHFKEGCWKVANEVNP